ncbi:MAG TPA: alpha/beta hydrolase [Euzebyales bacterium]|nr:alpha/beta hydrolase [Euzebyales bacterium]
MAIRQSAWTGMVPVDDTALYVRDTGGRGRPVVYLNGAYADQSHWRRVIADLGGDYRHITYDERARGRSKRSVDYSFAACLRDLDAVLKARGVDQPLLVGWSLGNEIAAASVPVLDRVTCPVWFVLATGDSLGTKDGEMEQGRATLDPVLARNPNLKVSAKVASNHTKILRRDSPAVAQTVRVLAASLGHGVG